MKNNNDINYIYEKLSSLYPHYSNKKPKAKIYSKAKFKINCYKLTKTEIVKKIIKLYENN